MDARDQDFFARPDGVSGSKPNSEEIALAIAAWPRIRLMNRMRNDRLL